MFNPYGVGWSWGCRVSATDIQSLRDIFSFAAASYLSLRVQLHQFESAFKFAHLLKYLGSLKRKFKIFNHLIISILSIKIGAFIFAHLLK
jgi:hypothetical protein